MPWRTEPEMDGDRKRYLAERRAIQPDIEKGVYPFKDVELDRADVEWLLETHESNGFTGPVDWDDGVQRKREGIDLRGGDLNGADLSGLPLRARREGSRAATTMEPPTVQSAWRMFQLRGQRWSMRGSK